ncbi:hypothetical protein GE09DRAFT_705998 [Coniochaeta sp. 2T2.1]|nr:hypothetical protein GE09DRAFT_705998 [Coniochaeta sp. 2T2.1]
MVFGLLENIIFRLFGFAIFASSFLWHLITSASARKFTVWTSTLLSIFHAAFRVYRRAHTYGGKHDRKPGAFRGDRLLIAVAGGSLLCFASKCKVMPEGGWFLVYQNCVVLVLKLCLATGFTHDDGTVLFMDVDIRSRSSESLHQTQMEDMNLYATYRFEAEGKGPKKPLSNHGDVNTGDGTRFCHMSDGNTTTASTVDPQTSTMLGRRRRRRRAGLTRVASAGQRQQGGNTSSAVTLPTLSANTTGTATDK